jgi:catechol 2,3-dioxygenase-like lactoylglutathione lyase family enzyme
MPDASTARAVFDHAGVSVADLERSHRFYAEVLGFDQVEDSFEFAEHELRGLVLTNATGTRVDPMGSPWWRSSVTPTATWWSSSNGCRRRPEPPHAA